MMYQFMQKPIRALLALILALAGLAAASASSLAAPVTIDLCAVTGTATLTGSVTVPIWGFVTKGSAADCSDVQGTAALPGPQLVANEGDVVTINVTNALPGSRTLTFEIPGINFDPGSADAASGATVTRGFTASAPGTYLYSGTGDAGRQSAMGLYGALIVRSATANQAYDAASTAYDQESVLIMSQVDPSFNAAPDTFDMRQYLASYWLVNGKAYPDTSVITATPGQRLLLRYLNAGYDNQAMMLLGMHSQVLARDAYLLNNPLSAGSETIPAGGTEDVILTIPTSAPPGVNGFPLFNRNLHVTSGTIAGASYVTPGGCLLFINNGIAPSSVAVVNPGLNPGGTKTFAGNNIYLPLIVR